VIHMPLKRKFSGDMDCIFTPKKGICHTHVPLAGSAMILRHCFRICSRFSEGTRPPGALSLAVREAAGGFPCVTGRAA
jgi:hypothetical protein